MNCIKCPILEECGVAKSTTDFFQRVGRYE